MDGIIQNLRNAVNELDALYGDKAYGRLIVDNDRVYLETNYDDAPEVDVLDDDVIEVITYSGEGREAYRKLTQINRKQALESLTAEGWPLYAGFYAFVYKRKGGE